MDPPIKPDESDCCNSGCNPCILEVYEEHLRKYQRATIGSPRKTDNCLSPTSFSIFKLINIDKISRDCSLYTFEYVRPHNISVNVKHNNASVLYEPGQHLLLKASVHGETFHKAYTPLFMENLPENRFVIIVKLYDNGRMSSFFCRLSIGCETSWRGPYGDFKLNYEEENILFIAQGTGIAPFYTIICNILSNEECYTFLTLFFCCNAENVLLREELYKLALFWNFKYELFLSGGSRGNFQEKYNEILHFSRLGVENIKLFFQGTKRRGKVLVCGAQSFSDDIKNMLMQCGVADGHITVF